METAMGIGDSKSLSKFDALPLRKPFIIIRLLGWQREDNQHAVKLNVHTVPARVSNSLAS